MLCEKYKNFLSWVIYQIYPRSFKDTNGDGIGDLKGVTEKLDYLKELGVNAIWLCPCYKSPNDDNGYDIADYYAIMDEFGMMEDMDELIEKAHARDIRVIMDLVANHTSADHIWFRESKKSRDNEYSDYYYWFDEKPNDWQSAFGGTAWEYCPEREQYYMHHYAVSQPDLNWENPKVRAGMNEVVDFWAKKGVDGFRCDVIHEISKDFENGKKSMGPRIHEFIGGLFGRPETEHLFTVGECHVYDKDSFRLLTAPERKELTTMFQFSHIDFGRESKFVSRPESLTGLRDTLIHWQRVSYEDGLLYTLFTDNHDQPPFLSRAGDVESKRYELATCLATMFYTLRGVPFIFQGQEYGTLSSDHKTIEEFRDVESLNYYDMRKAEFGEQGVIERLNFGSRDNARHPVAWDDSENGGFSTATPWIPVNAHYKEINLKKDRESEKSVFAFYKDLIALRKGSDAILYGDFTVLNKAEEPFFLFERAYEGEKIVVACNFEEQCDIPLPYEDMELLLTNYPFAGKTFAPYQIAIYKA